MSASTNLTSLAYDKETVFGTTDATPTFTLLPTTGGSPVNNITTAVSEVIRQDRQTDDLVVVDGDVSGEINYELSYEPYKDFLASVLMNTVSRSIALIGVTVNGTGTGDVLTKALIGDDVKVGDVIRLSSISDPIINGEYVCIESASGTVTVYPATGAIADETDVTVDATDIQQNGASPIEGYTIRKKADNAGADFFWYYRGCAINSMNFNFATGSILNGSIGIVGLTEEARDIPLDDEVLTDIPVPAYSIMNSVTNIGVIRISGVTLGLCNFSSIDLTIDNQINAAKSIGVLGACDLAAYSLQITGNTEVYFNNLDLYNKFLNAEAFSITIILTDVDGNTIGIDMPSCKFESLDTPISGKDAFLMQSGSFKALRDPVNNYMIKFSRIDV